MPYLLMIFEPIGQRATRTRAQGEEAYDSMLRFAGDLQSRGLLLAGESLESQKKAKRVEVREGQTRVLDGPYTEAKEMLGGFFLLGCATREEAIGIAKQCPAAQWCSVEVREVGPCFDE